MAARFAGSRSVDERRRRRLAVDAEETQLTDTADSSGSSGSKGARTATAAESLCEGERAQFPMRKLISPRKWKLFLIALLLLGAGAGMLAAGFHLERVAAEAGGATASLFDFHSAHMIRWYSVCCTFVAGQLALIIGWFRARNPKDFDGRYRIWIPAALCCFVTSFCLATNAHRAWSDALLHVWGIDFWNRESLAWMALALGAAPVILLGVHHDMRSCRGSRLLLWSAVSCWSLAAFRELQFDPGFEIPAEFAPLTDRGIELLGHILLLVCMLTHARHVLYITAQPPAATPSLFGRLVRRLPLPRIRFRRKAAADSNQETTESASLTPKRQRTKKGTTTRSTTGTARKKPTTRKTPARSSKSRGTAVAKANDDVETEVIDEIDSENRSETIAPSPRATAPKVAETQPARTAVSAAVATSGAAVRADSTTATSKAAQVPAQSSSAAFSTKSEPPSSSRPAAPPAVNAPATVAANDDADPEDSDEESWDEESHDGTNLRRDGGVDKDALKGLSKRERRALRKNAKDQQRAGRGG